MPGKVPSPPEFCRGAGAKRLRVLWIWHAAVVAEYQKPLAVLGNCRDLDLSLLVPKRWPERAGQMVRAESLPDAPFRLLSRWTLFTGFYYVYFFPGLLFVLLRYRPDIIYCYEEPHTILSALVLLLRRVFLPRSCVFLYAAQNIKKRYPLPFRLCERYCFGRADAILACGVKVAETLRSKGYARPLHVIPLPVDTSAFRPDAALRAEARGRLGISGDALLLGYAGKLVEEKGLHVLMSAFCELAREWSQLHLMLVGGGPLLEELRLRAREAGLEDRFHVPGVAHNSDLPLYIDACDIFVLPSETRPNWREQFGRAAVEAMSCGLPVIGSDSGEIPLVLNGAGAIFREGDSEALAACIRPLLGDAALRARMGQQARERAEALYSTEKVAAAHYSLYKTARRVPPNEM